jgi:hypothetical protein
MLSSPNVINLCVNKRDNMTRKLCNFGMVLRLRGWNKADLDSDQLAGGVGNSYYSSAASPPRLSPRSQFDTL